MQSISSKKLSEKDIYFTIRNNNISFLFDHFDKIVSIVGNPVTDDIIGGDEHGYFSCAIFNGFRVDYYKDSGILRKIQINESTCTIINGLTIGSKKETVEKLLLDGMFISDNNSYLFFKENPNEDKGIGYEIYYNENKLIKNIVITTIVFGP